MFDKQENRIRFDYNNMTQDYIGDKGLSEKELRDAKPLAANAYTKVKDGAGKGWMGWTDLPFNQKEIVADVLETAKGIRRKFKNFVVLGIGGSALGPIAVFQALCHLHYNFPQESVKVPSFTLKTTLIPKECWRCLILST